MTRTLNRDVLADALITGHRTRAVGAGIDPNHYEHVAARVQRGSDWTPRWLETAHEYRHVGATAARSGRAATAGDAYLQAALWAHFASAWPNPDRDAHAASIAFSAESYRAALGH